MTSRIEIPIDGNPDKLKKAVDESIASLDRLDKTGAKLTETTSKQTAQAEKWAETCRKTEGANKGAAAEAEAFTKKIGLWTAATVAAAAGAVILADKLLEATARFKDLGLEVGLSASAISKFSEPAALAGVTLDTVVSAMQRLSQAGMQAKDPTSQAAQALRAFNIDAGKFLAMPLDQQFETLARESEKFAGSAEKNAAIMALTGRSGADLQKVFSEIAAKGQLVAAVTDEQAEAADAFLDKLTGIKTAQQQIARDSMAVLLPSLNAIVDKFIELKGEGTAWTKTMEVIGVVLRGGAAAVGTLLLMLRDLGDKIGATAAQIAAFFTGNWSVAQSIELERRANAARYGEDLRKLWGDLGNVKKAQDAVDAGVVKAKVNFDPKGEADRRRQEKAAELEQMREEARLQKNLMDNLKAWSAAQEEFDAAQAKVNEDVDKGILALRDSNEVMRTEIETIGMSRVERELLLNTRAKEKQLAAAVGQYEREAIIAMREQTAELIRMRAEKEATMASTQQAIHEQARLWDDLGDRIIDAFERGKEGVKDLIRAMLQIFAKKWILDIGASLTGNSTMAAMAASTGSGTVAGMMSNAGGSMIGNALGLTGLGTTAASAAYAAAVPGLTSFGAGSQAAMLAAQTGEFGVAGLTSTAAAGGSTAASALATAMPYIAAALAVYALIKKFGDKGENPKAMLGFGGNAQAYTVDGVFGKEGFKSIETNHDDNKSLQTFFEGLKGMDERIAKMLQPGQVEAIKNTLATTAQREFAFPKGDGTAGAQLTKEYLQQKYGAVFGQLSPGIGDKIKNFAGTDKELLDYITSTVAAFDSLNTAMDAIKLTIGEVNGGTEQLEANLKALRGTIDSAQEAFDKAIKGGDPTVMLAAEQALTQAVLNRYNTEKEAIAQLVAGIEDLKASAYDFAMSNGERINRFGGSVNLGGIASGRLGDLRASITAGGTPEDRLANIGAFVSVLDQWVGAEQSALEANAQGAAAIAQAQSSAAQAAVAALQQQLQLAQSWKGVLDAVEQTIDRMKYSGSNPLSSVARFGSAGEDVNSLLGQYRGATGTNRVDLANRLMGAVGTRQSLAEQSFQRPSQEYLDAYNQNMAIYAEIKADAKTEAEKAIDLQTKIEANTALANQYAAAASGASAQASAQMDAIKAQARDLAMWAQEQYDLAAGEQQKILTDQLNAITGGLDVGLYTAKLQTDMLAVLDSIDTQITAFLSGTSTNTVTTTTTTPAGNTVVNPGGGGGGTDGNTLVLQPIVAQLDGKNMMSFVVDVSNMNATANRRTLATS